MGASGPYLRQELPAHVCEFLGMDAHMIVEEYRARFERPEHSRSLRSRGPVGAASGARTSFAWHRCRCAGVGLAGRPVRARITVGEKEGDSIEGFQQEPRERTRSRRAVTERRQCSAAPQRSKNVRFRRGRCPLTLGCLVDTKGTLARSRAALSPPATARDRSGRGASASRSATEAATACQRQAPRPPRQGRAARATRSARRE